MKRSTKSIQALFVALILLMLAGCATVPEPLRGDASQFTPLMANQVSEQVIGARVRWGGMIVSTQPQTDRTCMEILARELDRSARPITRNDLHFGRFMACGAGFRDPAIYTEGREVSLVGRLDGFMTAPIGEFMYRYPTVSVEQLYLWPERMAEDPYRDHYGHLYYHGWWGPFNPYPIRRIYVPVEPKPKDKK